MKFLYFILFFFTGYAAYPQQIGSLATGNWETAGTWSLSRVPGSGDTITISAGHTVTIITQCTISPNPVIIHIYGTLNFQTGKKLVLPCGSVINIYSGGQVTAGNGGGNSNYIEICGEVVWKAGDGTLTGPLTLQASTLPVTLLDFTAKPESFTVTVNWTTASEINNDYFTIERTLNGTEFEPLTRINGAGNSNALIHYSWVDEAPHGGLSYYRLKQTDFDGKFSFSDLAAVNINRRYTDFKVFPNPVKANEKLNVVIGETASKEILIVVVDMLGNEAYSKVIVPDKNRGAFVIDIEKRLNPGVYLVTGSSDDTMISKKVVVR